MGFAEFACHQVRTFERARAYRHIGALLQDVDDLIGEHNVQCHVGIVLQELGYQRQQEMMAKGNIGIHPKPTARQAVQAGAAFGLF
ncbi:hypothetical protein D3C81_1303690 [compost metagenome]